jgi:RND family efflux transporter MFP subunit
MKKIIPSLLIVALAGVATATMVINKQPPAARTARESSVLVNTVEAKSADVTFTIESQGTVMPRTETTIVTEVAGLVTSVSDQFVVGGFFNKGDVLLTLDPVDYEVAVEQARANLLTAKAQLTQETAQAQQAAKEWDQTGRSRDEAPLLALRTPYLEEARARVLYADAELRRAERKLTRTVIRAPYTGLVREKFVDIGQFAGSGARIAQTFAVDFAEVRLPLSNNDIEFLELPRPGYVQVNEIGASASALHVNAIAVSLHTTIGGKQYEWQGQIVRTEGVIDSNSRMQYAIAQVDDPYGLQHVVTKPPLSIGSFVNARLQGISAKGVFTIPQKVVRDGNQVMIMDEEQRLRLREVTVIRNDSVNSWVSEGLNDHDQIITTALEVPIDGMKLELFSDSF